MQNEVYTTTTHDVDFDTATEILNYLTEGIWKNEN